MRKSPPLVPVAAVAFFSLFAGVCPGRDTHDNVIPAVRRLFFCLDGKFVIIYACKLPLLSDDCCCMPLFGRALKVHHGLEIEKGVARAHNTSIIRGNKFCICVLFMLL